MVASSTVNLEEALASLGRAEEQKLAELDEIRLTKASLERLIGVTPSHSRATVSLEYQGKGPVEAAELYLKEVGKALTTREIVDGMVARGWSTKSRNPVATVYATLTNAKKKFKRTDSNQWELAKG